MSDLYQLRTSYFVAGAIVEYGIIVEAAPIIKWSVGRPIEVLLKWIEFIGGEHENLGPVNSME